MNNVKIVVFFGGMFIKKDEDVLKKNCFYIIVGIFGRILVFCYFKVFNLKNVKYFVFDECDKMLVVFGKLFELYF